MLRRSLLFTLGVIAAVALTVTLVSAQTANGTNPRFGKWKLQSNAAPPASNIMTYEPYNGTGMKITIDAVSANGTKSSWGYTTMFDGKDEVLTGNPSTDTGAVKIINSRVNEITYKKNGKITQVLRNVISPDGTVLDITYVSYDADGKITRVTYATYEKMK